MTREESIQRGQRAQNLLNDEVLISTLDTMEAEYLKAWRDSKPVETEFREQLWMLSGLIKEFRVHLNVTASNGKMDQAQIDKLRKQK